jgi:polysaccharide pyruvyl transferase CsaB
MLAQFLGLKTLAWAQGIGPLNRSISKALSRKTFGGCDRVSVRDEGSQELLTSWGISSLRAPDPVWNLKADDTVKSDLDPATIAVNLRPHSSLPEIRLDLLIEALKLLQAQINCPILLLPFHRGEDDLLADAIAEILNLGAKVQILKIDDPRQLKAVFAQVRFLIGMRLHSLIMAASMGCSSFALSYDPKVTQLMAHANLPGWELDQLPPTPQEIAHQWERSYRQNHHLDREALTSIQQQVNCHQELLSQLIVPSKQPLGEGRN